jgi:hypothetical protein
MLGHGGAVLCDDSLHLGQMARFAMQFCAEESCGKCTPCRIGSTRGVEVIDRLLAAPDSAERQRQRALLDDLCDTMQYGSLCALGGMTPSGAKCHASFPGRFRAGHSGASTMSCQCGAGASCNKDMGTPARAGEASITLTIDGQNISVPPGTSVMRGGAAGHRHSQTVRHRQPGAVRLLPHVHGGNRRPSRLSGVLHHAGIAGMVVRTQRQAGQLRRA